MCDELGNLIDIEFQLTASTLINNNLHSGLLVFHPALQILQAYVKI